MLRAGLAILVLLLAVPAAAHDFWLQPRAFWIEPAALTSLTLEVGHGPDRRRSPIPLSRITRFQAIAANGTAIELRDRLHPGADAADGDFRLNMPGTYLLVLETDDQARSFLPALRFNDYLRAEGLTPALEQRERLKRAQSDGSENYRRVAKSILQVGGICSDAPTTAPLGLTLEIVPDHNPCIGPWPAVLPVHVVYEGQPLGGALVKLTDLEHDEAPIEWHRTDDAGQAAFTVPRSGNWLLNVVWTRPQPQWRDTEFDTVFSSLSFGGRADLKRHAVDSM